MENLENEIWKTTKEFPDYQVSSLGNIKSLKYNSEKIKKVLIDHKGYFYVKLWNSGKSKNKKIHILMYESFNNYKLKSDECLHHIDFNSKNNTLNNLRLMNICDHKSLHRISINNPLFGKSHTNESKKLMSKNSRTYKLKEWQVKAIYQISNSPITKQLKITQKEIGEVFGVNERTVSAIKNRKTWSQINLENLL